MKPEVLTSCGYRCDLCLAYRPNVEIHDERKKLSDGWFEYFGFRIPAEQIVCEGCMSTDESERIDKNCPVRSCVNAKKIVNCAYCDEYICPKLKDRIVEYSEVLARYGKDISMEDYENFIKPYESKPRLEFLRSKITKSYNS